MAAQAMLCVRIPLHTCSHTPIHVAYPHTAIYVSSYCYICVLILLYMCPHTTAYVFPYPLYMYICVLIFRRRFAYTSLSYADVKASSVK